MGASGAPRDVGDVGGHFGSVRRHQGCRGCQDVLGADRDSRYSGARRGIGASGDIGGLLGGVEGCFRGVRGIRGVGILRVYWGADRDSRYSGATMGMWGISGHWGLLGGVGGHLGCQAVSGV